MGLALGTNIYSCARPNLLFRKLYVKEPVAPLGPFGLCLGRRVSRVVRARMPKTQESYSEDCTTKYNVCNYCVFNGYRLYYAMLEKSVSP